MHTSFHTMYHISLINYKCINLHVRQLQINVQHKYRYRHEEIPMCANSSTNKHAHTHMVMRWTPQTASKVEEYSRRKSPLGMSSVTNTWPNIHFVQQVAWIMFWQASVTLSLHGNFWKWIIWLWFQNCPRIELDWIWQWDNHSYWAQ